MLVSTEGIILRIIKFKETSIIAHALTPDHGIVPLIVSGVRSKNNKGKAAQFQVGNLLEIIFYDKNKDTVRRLKESQLAIHYKTLASQLPKMALTQYVVEVTGNCLYQSALSTEDIFPLVKNVLLYVDTTENPTTNLGIYFVWHLIDRLGLRPNLEERHGDFLDLQSGHFVTEQPMHQSFLHREIAEYVNVLFRHPIQAIHEQHIPTQVRRSLISGAHLYLKVHLPYFNTPNSVTIYRDILSM